MGSDGEAHLSDGLSPRAPQDVLRHLAEPGGEQLTPKAGLGIAGAEAEGACGACLRRGTHQDEGAPGQDPG